MEICACSATVTCQYHARLPKPCPSCSHGQLQRYAHNEGWKVVPIYRDGHLVTWLKSSAAIWTCNVCEHCE